MCTSSSNPASGGSVRKPPHARCPQSGDGGRIDWFKMGDGWTWTSRDLVESADRAREGWEEVKRRIADETYHYLLLDEFTYAMKFGWVDTAEVVEMLTTARVPARRGHRPRRTRRAHRRGGPSQRVCQGHAPVRSWPPGPEGGRVVRPRVCQTGCWSSSDWSCARVRASGGVMMRSHNLPPRSLAPDDMSLTRRISGSLLARTVSA